MLDSNGRDFAIVGTVVASDPSGPGFGSKALVSHSKFILCSIFNIYGSFVNLSVQIRII